MPMIPTRSHSIRSGLSSRDLPQAAAAAAPWQAPRDQAYADTVRHDMVAQEVFGGLPPPPEKDVNAEKATEVAIRRCTTPPCSHSLPVVRQQAAQPRRASSTPAVRQAYARSLLRFQSLRLC